MPPTFDSHVWECAQLWISRYGSHAREEALKRAREFEENGANGMAWRRVADAIGHLDGVPRPPASHGTGARVRLPSCAEPGLTPGQFHRDADAPSHSR